MNQIWLYFIQFMHAWSALAWVLVEWGYWLFATGSQCVVALWAARWWARGGGTGAV